MEVSELKKVTVIVLATIVAALSLAAGAATAPTQATSLTIYSGREERLVKPIMDRFTRDTGIELKVRYASSTSLATALVEEGREQPGGHLLVAGARNARSRGRARPARPAAAGDSRQGAGAVLDAQPALGGDERPLSRARLQHERAPARRPARVRLGAYELPLEGEDRHRADQCVLPGVSRGDDPPVRRGARQDVATRARGQRRSLLPEQHDRGSGGRSRRHRGGSREPLLPLQPARGHAGPPRPEPLVPGRRPGQSRPRGRCRRRVVHDEERGGEAVRRLPPLEVGDSASSPAAPGRPSTRSSRAFRDGPGFPR